MEFRHEPVLLREVIEYLNIRPDGIYVDGTLGGAGHSGEIARRLTSGGLLIGIDQDREAVEAASEKLKPYAQRVRIIHDNYEHIPEILDAGGIASVNGILLDVGVSSYQLDNPERGFSYNRDEPLDMRMNREDTLTAADILNTWSEEDLCRILRDYGEERYAAGIARRIVAQRGEKAFVTTGDFVRVIRACVPAKMQERYGNPCKRSFQAVRIACNRELDVLEASMDRLIERLAPGGRLAVITFHSLEDRIVKNAFRRGENPCTCPPEFPVCVCGKKPTGRILTRKPVTASAQERERNSRAASAKLRVFERI